MASVIKYVTIAGDRWDLIAWRYYGDATRLTELIAANPAIPVVGELLPGVTVTVPILPQQVSAQVLPPWTAAAVAAGELQ